MAFAQVTRNAVLAMIRDAAIRPDTEFDVVCGDIGSFRMKGIHIICSDRGLSERSARHMSGSPKHFRYCGASFISPTAPLLDLGMREGSELVEVY